MSLATEPKIEAETDGESDFDPTWVDPTMAGIPMTLAEFDALEDGEEGYRYELIHGVLVVSPSPARNERDVNQELGHLLLSFAERRPGVLDDTLNEDDVRTPLSRRRADRAIWCGRGRLPGAKEQADILVEFVSKGRRNWKRDYEEKVAEYLDAGVKEYWIFDRFARRMTVHRQVEGQRSVRVVTETETYATDLLPGFELSLAHLLAVCDRRSAQR